MKKTLAIVLAALIMVSCKKDTINTPEPEPVKVSDFIQCKFIFVNKGDANLKATNLESSFYRINKNNSSIVYRNYPTVGAHDSIVHYSDSTKIGGQKKFDVQLFFFRGDTIYKRRRYLSTLTADTIKKPADGIEIFRWPEDTIRYIKILQLPY